MRTSIFRRLVFCVCMLVLSSCATVSADELVPVERTQHIASSSVNAAASDQVRERTHVGAFSGLESTSGKSEVECLESSSSLTSLVQFDVARINLDLSIAACDGLTADAIATTSGKSEITLHIERDATKIVSVSNDSTQSVVGVASITRIGDENPLWSFDFEHASNRTQSAQAIDLSEGNYRLELSAEQSDNRNVDSSLRLSLVNRGDISGNEVFDSADLAVLSAILSQQTYGIAADLDDDGDNDETDRRLWINGLREGALGAAIVEDYVAEVLATQDASTTEGPSSPINYAPSDLDRNGVVEFVDFLEFRRDYGNSVSSGTASDLDGNGFVGFDDFLAFSQSYGAVGSSSFQSVPEPNSQLLTVVLASCVVLFRRQRIKKR